MIIDVTRLSVSPFALEGIVEMKVEQALNQHAAMYLKGIIPKEKGDSGVMSTDDSTVITVSDQDRISEPLLKDRSIIWKCGRSPLASKRIRLFVHAHFKMQV